MESSNEFKLWLKKFHEQLSTKNQALKTSLHDKQHINQELSNNIENVFSNSLNTSTLAIDAIPNNVEIQLEGSLNNLKIKSEQLNKCNETINAKVEEETKNMRFTFYDMITNNETALKPYYEVEEAINELTRKIDFCERKQHEDKENCIKKLKERQLVYTEIKQSIIMLESTEQEMRLCVQNGNKNVEEKLKSLRLNSIEEANKESNESKALLLEISNIESELNI